MQPSYSPTCLLCGSSRCAVQQSLTAAEILKLWDAAGLRFSPDAIQGLVEEGTVYLYACEACGFQFFNPRLAGNAAFYEQLQAQGPGYYAEARPENQRNARYALRHGFRTVLDVGCGTGYALDAAKAAGLETFGIELNRVAGAAAASRGHHIFPVLLEQLDAAWEKRFDLISLNQLLEHVPDPVGLVQQCRRFLSPRGVIAIAVPGAGGILRFAPWLEANWPPHHISRWRPEDLRHLAQRAGLRVLQSGGDQLVGSLLQMVLLNHHQHCQVLGKPYHGPSPRLIGALSFLYRKSGAKFLCARGQSIYGYLGQ